MKIQEYLRTREAGFYKVLCDSMTPRRLEQFFDAVNSWQENELTLFRLQTIIDSDYTSSELKRDVEILPVKNKSAIFYNFAKKTYYISNVEFIRFTTVCYEDFEEETYFYPITTCQLKAGTSEEYEGYEFEIIDDELIESREKILIDEGYISDYTMYLCCCRKQNPYYG